MSIEIMKTLYRDSMYNYIRARVNKNVSLFDMGYTAGTYRTLDSMLESVLDEDNYLDFRYICKLEMMNIFDISFMKVSEYLD